MYQNTEIKIKGVEDIEPGDILVLGTLEYTFVGIVEEGHDPIQVFKFRSASSVNIERDYYYSEIKAFLGAGFFYRLQRVPLRISSGPTVRGETIVDMIQEAAKNQPGRVYIAKGKDFKDRLPKLTV